MLSTIKVVLNYFNGELLLLFSDNQNNDIGVPYYHIILCLFIQSDPLRAIKLTTKRLRAAELATVIICDCHFPANKSLFNIGRGISHIIF